MIGLQYFDFRGPSFRPDYLETANLRGIFPDATTLGLSATVNEKVYQDIGTIFNWEPVVVALPPDRENIFIDVVCQPKYVISNDLKWVVDGIKEKGVQFPKTVIFAQTKPMVNDIHTFLKRALGNQAYKDEIPDKDNRLISKYHGKVSEGLQTWTLKNMLDPNSPLCCLVTTVAFGIGINIRDIRTVVQFGKCPNMMTFWQQMGRAGRDGNDSLAICYPKSTAGDDKELFDELKKQEVCSRKLILNHFLLPEQDKSLLDYLDRREPCRQMCDSCECALCKCCSFCEAHCDCNA